MTPSAVNAHWYPKNNEDDRVMVCPGYARERDNNFSRWACVGYGLPHYSGAIGGNPGQGVPPRYYREIVTPEITWMLGCTDGYGLKTVGSWAVNCPIGNHGDQLSGNEIFADLHIEFFSRGLPLYQQLRYGTSGTKWDYPFNLDCN